jgi:hypothetical protein
MKFNQIAVAAFAVVAASQSFAANTYLTGASASSVNVMKAAKNLCVDAGGTFKLYKSIANTALNSLGNQFTGVCSTDFTGTAVNQVRVNVAGGSESAVTATTTAGTSFLAPVEASCTAITGTESLAAANFSGMSLFACPAAQVNDAHLSDGGMMDVEGPVFNTAYNPDDFAAVGFSQVFGVAVNSNLYNALQVAQFGATATCTTNTSTKYTAACQPSISKAQMASLLDSNTFGPAKTKGGQFLVGGTTDATKITYCMRPQTSGTQQAAQMYFLNYSGTGALGGKNVVVSSTTSLSKFAASLNASSSNVKTCLNATTATDGYKFGVLSAENNPIGGSDTYRFVKVNGVAAAQGVANTDSNTATALTGEYDFVYESVAYCPAGTCTPFVQAILDNVDVALPAGSSTAGLFLTGTESAFSRGGKASNPYIAH